MSDEPVVKDVFVEDIADLEDHVGRHLHRLTDNPMEQRLHERWLKENERGILELLMSPDRNQRRPVSKRDAEVAATVIQWLGSHVGQCFLRDVGFGTEESRGVVCKECGARVNVRCVRCRKLM